MYGHVLVGTDGSATATLAVEAAARLAKAHDARLTIVHAFRPGAVPMPPEDEAREFHWRYTAGAMADQLVGRAMRCAQAVVGGGLQIDTRSEPGKAVAVLVAAVDALRPDAVVVGNADIRAGRSYRSVGHSLSRRV
ncbi:MAG: Universal stress protein family, partial [Actinomycetota bacterium]